MRRPEIPWRSVLRVAPAILAVTLLGIRDGPRFSRRLKILGLTGTLALFLIGRGITWWSKRRLKSWPSAYAFIEFAKVAEDPKGGPSDHVLELSYSYQVDGARYGGAYRESFRSEDQAKKLLRFFEDLPVPVRYHPRDPSRSVLDPHWLASLATRASVAGAARRTKMPRQNESQSPIAAKSPITSSLSRNLVGSGMDCRQPGGFVG